MSMMKRNNVVETFMGTWGIVLRPNMKYNIVFEQPFHLKKAVLDFKGFIKEEFHFRVVLQDNNDDSPPLTLCILNRTNSLQTALDLVFEKGDDVTMFVKTDVYNLDSSSFSVHLSGVTSRDETFARRSNKPKTDQNGDTAVKLRSGSLPDEYFQKKGLPSPLKKNAPVGPGEIMRSASASTPATPTSPAGKSLCSESTFFNEPPKSPTAKDSPFKREGSTKKTSFKDEVFGKFGKLLSKS